MDDFDETSATTGLLELGVISGGELESAGDKDWFAITLEADRAYQIRVEGSENANGTLDDPILGGVYDASENLVYGTFDDDSGAGLDSLLTFTPSSTGQYYIEVSGYGDATGTYSVSVDDVTPVSGSVFDVIAIDVVRNEGDAGDSSIEFTVSRSGNTAEAASVDWGVEAAPEGDSADADDFSGQVFPGGTLDFAAGETFQVVSVNVAGDTDIEPDESFLFSLSNPSTDSAIGAGSKLGTIVDDDTSTEGIAFLEVFFAPSQFEGQVDLTPYEFIVARSGDTSISASAEWAVEEVDALASADADDFEGGVLPSGMVEFAPGETSKAVTIYVNGDEDFEGNEYFSIVLGNPGVNTQVSSAGKLGTIIDDDSDDFGDDPSGAGKLGLGMSKLGTLEQGGDNDWYAIHLEAGIVYEIGIEGVATDQGTLDNPLLEGVYDIDSIKLPDSSDDDGGTGTNSKLIFTPTESATYYIAVSGAGGDIGSYHISVDEVQGALIEGTEEADSLTGEGGNDTLVGYAGRDILQGLGGDDRIEGGDDIDTAVYDGELLSYQLVREGNEIAVAGPAADGNDLLVDIERVQFADISVAFDLDGNAGSTAKLLGVLLGVNNWNNAELIGVGLDIFDNFDMSFEEVMDLGLEVILGPNPSNADVVNMIYTNLIGQAPSEADLAALTADLLDSGAFTQLSLAVAAADLDFNIENIGLVGLADTGLGYLPVAG